LRIENQVQWRRTRRQQVREHAADIRALKPAYLVGIRGSFPPSLVFVDADGTPKVDERIAGGRRRIENSIDQKG